MIAHVVRRAAEARSIDAVIVATPDWQHVNHVSACLKANKHVYCDGEICDSSGSTGAITSIPASIYISVIRLPTSVQKSTSSLT